MYKFKQLIGCISVFFLAQHIKIIGTTFTQSYHSRFVTLLSYDLGGLNHIYSLGHIDIFLFVPEYELQVGYL